jgi:hypothetical protein
MNNFIPHDVIHKIKEAQDNTMNKIKSEANAEVNYISQKFLSELQTNLEVLLSDPFNIYLKVPRVSTNNSKIYLAELRKQYLTSFQHELQLSGSSQTGDACFYVLLKHDRLVCHGDPRPQQLMLEAEPVDPIFNESEKKKFEAEIEASANTSKRPSIRSGYSGEKKDILVPLFLQRRNSRLSLPTISARAEHAGTRRQVEVSVSDNPEESET